LWGSRAGRLGPIGFAAVLALPVGVVSGRRADRGLDETLRGFQARCTTGLQLGTCNLSRRPTGRPRHADAVRLLYRRSNYGPRPGRRETGRILFLDLRSAELSARR